MTKIYYVYWDYNDARFSYYDEMYVTNTRVWEKKVKREAIKNKNHLMESFLNDGGEEKFNSFEEWVQWCIDNFSYYDEDIEIDNYKN